MQDSLPLLKDHSGDWNFVEVVDTFVLVEGGLDKLVTTEGMP